MDTPEVPVSAQSTNILLDVKNFGKKPIDQKIESDIKSLQKFSLPANPRVKSLVDYMNDLSVTVTDVDKPTSLPSLDILIHLNELESRNELTQGFSSLILRLQRETKYLKELEITKVARGLLNGLSNNHYSSQVKFIESSRSGIKNGDYDNLLNRVRIFDKEPTLKEIWVDLIKNGRLPDPISTLHHELIHEKGSTRLTQPMDILYEVHAWDATLSSPTYGLDRSLAYNLADNLIEHYGWFLYQYSTSISTADLVHKAYDLIHALRIFGINDLEIASLIKGERFDIKAKTYPKLQTRLDSIQNEWKISNPEIWKAVAYLQNDQFELERMIQIQKARKIAAEELLIESTGKGWVK